MRIVLTSLAGLALLGIVLVAAVAGLWPSPAGEPQPTEPLNSGPESMGIRVSPAPGVPNITEDEAVAIANSIAVGYATEASRIDAEYVLYSNQYQTPSATRHAKFENSAAWLVTYYGLNIPGHGGYPTIVNHEYNIVIDDRSGEVLAEFSYR